MAGRYSQTKASRAPKVLLILGVVLLLLVSAGLGLWWYWWNLPMPENASLGGLELGGMTHRQANAAVSAASEEMLGKSLKLVLPEETLVFSPKEAGMTFRQSQALGDVYRGTQGDLLKYLSWEESYFRSALQGYAQRHDTALTQPSWELEGDVPELGTDKIDLQAPCQTLNITLGTPESHLDQEAALQAIEELYRHGLQPSETGFEITMDVVPEKEPEEPDLAAIAESCRIAGVDDSLSMSSYQLLPGSYGCEIDLEQGQQALEKAQFGDTVVLPMHYVEPEILGDQVYFRDVLGTCDTKHNSDENRNTNLRLICEILNGHVVQPGEEFSYNAVVGERTPERGFQPAPAYSGTVLVKDYGGGACQISTTLYNCLLLADMEITARVGHGALVSYVPRGLDAAVNWATHTDLAFRNNSHFPVMIQAKVEDGYVKMELLGTDEKDYYIKMESGSSEDGSAIYAVSYKCKYDKETDELISRERESTSTYLKNLG